MSNIKELIRQEIDAFYTEYKAKFHQNGDSYHLGIIDGLDMAKRILDTLPDEPITTCDQLEEAAEKSAILQYEMPTDVDKAMQVMSARIFHEIGFKAGAEWMKTKMMEGAVEGKVFMSFAPGHNQMVMADVDLPTNTKVKVIIVKED